MQDPRRRHFGVIEVLVFKAICSFAIFIAGMQPELQSSDRGETSDRLGFLDDFRVVGRNLLFVVLYWMTSTYALVWCVRHRRFAPLLADCAVFVFWCAVAIAFGARDVMW